jgi:predicted helicase
MITQYLAELDKLYRAGNATEHSYRPALKTLLENITSGLTITNEPKHIECGAPDYIITKNGIPLGYIEAKDIKTGLNNKANKEQFDRYRQSLNNLIITDYLTFRLFADGELVMTVTIASESGGGIAPDTKQFPVFLELINRFTKYSGATIYNSEQLAKMMAAKAKMLAEVIKKALDTQNDEKDNLGGQHEDFKKILIHELAPDEFADIYAQTIAYGLFAARLSQKDNHIFSRSLAPHLIPASNPFLRKFFQYIAGFDLDTRIAWIIDALADIFNCVAVEEIIKEFGKAAQDPYIHFYETFLAEYDPTLRETRGVYYTPLPVVKFIVQAADDILKTEFGLQKGLADHSKVNHIVADKNGKKEKEIEMHKVQILDPAAGTGTFLAAVIDKIYSYFSRNKGAWGDYCENHLIPRLNGFEILMASYAMAHFKLDIKLQETGWMHENGQAGRLHVYLTNSLEEAPENVPELFMAQWLAMEAKEAGRVKRDVPVMVVLANPPYNVSTQNKNEWIDSLVADYKKDLNEKNIQPLSDDYIKFIRYGQYLVERTGFGVLAYISNNSFIDGIIHRKMRKTLLEKFDSVYILDLHGNSRKKENAPDGGKDENVFDIMQGTSINIFIKTGKKVEGSAAKIYHSEIFGRREAKYAFLSENTLSTIKWHELNPESPYFFFVHRNLRPTGKYEKGFLANELFTVYTSGIKTHDNNSLISFDVFAENNHRYLYHPFDVRNINYDLKKVKRHRYPVMKNMLKENVALLLPRQAITGEYGIFIADTINDINYTGTAGQFGAGLTFPLYIYPDENSLDKDEERRPNLNMNIVRRIADKIGLQFIEEIRLEKNNPPYVHPGSKPWPRGGLKNIQYDNSTALDTICQAQDGESPAVFTPLGILDYIYAVLYSNNYRQKYAEFLKIDFPRIPYPENAQAFQRLASIGSHLRGLHLMENIQPAADAASFPKPGTNEIETVSYKGERVYINKEQYFENIVPEVWNYRIGGYQPAEKWLKERKGRALSFEDIEHYQKIITVLNMTIELQQHIDEETRNV